MERCKKFFLTTFNFILTIHLFSDSLKLRPAVSVFFFYQHHTTNVFNEIGIVQTVRTWKAFQVSPHLIFNVASNSRLIAGISSTYSPIRHRSVYDKHPTFEKVFHPIEWNTHFFIHSFFFLLEYDFVKALKLSVQLGLSTGIMYALTNTKFNDELKEISNQEIQFISENFIGFDRFKVFHRADQLLLKVQRPISEKYSINAAVDAIIGLNKMHLMDTYSVVFSNVEELTTIYRSYIYIRPLFLGISLSKYF